MYCLLKAIQEYESGPKNWALVSLVNPPEEEPYVTASLPGLFCCIQNPSWTLYTTTHSSFFIKSEFLPQQQNFPFGKDMTLLWFIPTADSDSPCLWQRTHLHPYPFNSSSVLVSHEIWHVGIFSQNSQDNLGTNMCLFYLAVSYCSLRPCQTVFEFWLILFLSLSLHLFSSKLCLRPLGQYQLSLASRWCRRHLHLLGLYFHKR